MTDASAGKPQAPDPSAANTTAMGALAGAADDLHRAALILRQIASGTSARLARQPEDYRRIAGQLSERARACAAAEDALAARLDCSASRITAG